MNSYQGNPRLKGTVTLSHGSGGRDMHTLLRELIYPILGEACASGTDAAFIDANILGPGECLAFTTDSYTVSPLFFPGGDIGTLAVNGTVNDLAVAGATPRYLSCGLIIEEGFAIETLRRVLQSLRDAADAAGVSVITGDTKVVHRGAADGLFINTSGIGIVPAAPRLNLASIQPGDRLLASGYIGDHGAAILAARGDLHLDLPVDSDCRALNALVGALLRACPDTRALRDATRGGVAAVVNEMASAAGLGIALEESALPIRPAVRAACELLGLDPLHLANEGLMIAAVPESEADTALATLRSHADGANAAIIGRAVTTHPGMVSLHNAFGGERALDMPAGEILPRIC